MTTLVVDFYIELPENRFCPWCGKDLNGCNKLMILCEDCQDRYRAEYKAMKKRWKYDESHPENREHRQKRRGTIGGTKPRIGTLTHWEIKDHSGIHEYTEYSEDFSTLNFTSLDDEKGKLRHWKDLHHELLDDEPGSEIERKKRFLNEYDKWMKSKLNRRIRKPVAKTGYCMEVDKK